MCRYAYAGPYKDRFACFTCRKAFKRRKPDDVFGLKRIKNPFAAKGAAQAAAKAREASLGVVVRCPQCGGEMHDMGMDFKAPRQDDVKQWKKVEVLYSHGVTFHSCGCSGPGLMPDDVKEIEAFLNDRRRTYSEGEKLLRRIARSGREKERGRGGRKTSPARGVAGRTWGPAIAPRKLVMK